MFDDLRYVDDIKSMVEIENNSIENKRNKSKSDQFQNIENEK